MFRKFPVLRLARDFLLAQDQVVGAMMCGSGSTMMAIARTPADAAALRDPVQRRFGSTVWTWSGSTIFHTGCEKPGA